MSRKGHHITGIGISVIVSGVVGQAIGMGLYMHGQDINFFEILPLASD